MALTIGQKLRQFGKMTAAVMSVLLPPSISREDMADAIGYVENAGVPSGVTPDFIGQKLFDTTNSVFYVAYATTSGAWALGGVGTVTAAELAVIDGVVGGTSTANKAVVLDANSRIDTLDVGANFKISGTVLAIPITDHMSTPTVAVDHDIMAAKGNMQVVGVSGAWNNSSTSGTYQLTKVTGNGAPSSGTTMLQTTFNTAGANRTVNVGTLNATVASLQLTANDRLCAVLTGTETNLLDLAVTVHVKPIA